MSQTSSRLTKFASAFALIALLAATALAWRSHTATPQSPAQVGPEDPALAALVEAMRAQDVHLDPKSNAMWIPVRIEVRDELLEYLLVGSAGATHESMFSTHIRPSVLNTALLALGVAPGRNAKWQAREPRPSEAEMRAGVTPYEVTVPEGDGFELNLAWRQGEELFFYRVEDLLRNLLTGASMQRHRWVYLGSKMLPPDPRKKDKDPREQFAADVYQNLINVAYFNEAYTLITSALPECVEQTIWLPNAWLIPQRGEQVALFFSRGRLTEIPAALAAGLPKIEPAARDARRVLAPGDEGPPPPKDGR